MSASTSDSVWRVLWPRVIELEKIVILAQQYISGEAISSGMALISATDGKVYKYDIANEDHYGKFIGISKTSATANLPIQIYKKGDIANEVGSGWGQGLIYYIASTSLLTTTAPLVGTVVSVGVGIATDRIIINSSQEIITI